MGIFHGFIRKKGLFLTEKDFNFIINYLKNTIFPKILVQFCLYRSKLTNQGNSIIT